MKHYLSALLLLTLFISCNEKDEDPEFIWKPLISLEKGDGQIRLNLTDPRPFTDYVSDLPADPGYFNIYISGDLENIEFYDQVDIAEEEVIITDLVNGDPYCVYVSSHRNGFETLYTDTLMAVPSEPYLIEPLLDDNDYYIVDATLSYDGNYLAYQDNSSPYDYIYLTPVGTADPKWIAMYSRSASWSPVQNELVFISYDPPDVELNYYNAESGHTNTFFAFHHGDYAIENPVFSPDVEMIGYLSNEEDNSIYYDLWLYDRNLEEKQRLTHFEDIDFRAIPNINWYTAEEILIAGYINTASQGTNIYCYNLSTEQLIPLIETTWRERNPVMSPDQTRIAFVSNRSRTSEIWIYNLQTETYNQITGSIEDQYDIDLMPTRNRIQWLNNDQLLFTVIEGGSKPVVVSLN